MQQVDAAIAAGTWPTPPMPHLFAWGNNEFGQLGLAQDATGREVAGFASGGGSDFGNLAQRRQ